jgi:hypothetical protein
MPAFSSLRAGILLTIASVVLLAGVADAQVKPALWPSQDSVDPQEVKEAIRKGVDALWKLQTKSGIFEGVPRGTRPYDVGATAQATYALLECGITPRDKRIQALLEWLVKQEVDQTYDLSFRILALTAAYRKMPTAEIARQVQKDAHYLYNSISKSDYGYTYRARGEVGDPGNTWIATSDASNSQYALLAIWMAVEYCKAEVPEKWWKLHAKYWAELQSRNGGWGYTPEKIRPEPYLSMTAAGLASMFVCIDYLYAREQIHCRTIEQNPSIQKGLEWMDKNFAGQVGKKWPFYTLYGVERVGLASGYKFFGKVDWYKRGTRYLLKTQRDDGIFEPAGGWGSNENTATCYALLFLQRGLHPVLFNKLQYKGNWNNRPRDLASFTHWMRSQYEDPFHWQIIQIDTPVQQWHDAPILYIAGSTKPEFTDEQLEKIRTYVLQGGTLLTVAECNAPGFQQGIREVYGRLFPQWELTVVQGDDPLRTTPHQLPPAPELYKISNGVRTIAVHSDFDLSRYWQMRQTATAKVTFQIGANVAYHLTDRFLLRPRGTTHWPDEVDLADPEGKIRIGLIRHGANYNAEPLALERLARMMGHLHKVEVQVAPPVEIEELAESDLDLAILTGTGRLTLSAQQQQKLKEFTEAGNMLLMTPMGGSDEFSRDSSGLLRKIYGAGNVLPLPETSDIISPDGRKIETFQLRDGTKVDRSRLDMALGKNGPAALHTPRDMLTALVGYPAREIRGYAPETAFALMRNILMHQIQRSK